MLKPWEKPQLINKDGRWVVAVPVDDRTRRDYDITGDMHGWLQCEVEKKLSNLSDEVKANGDMMLHWVQNNPNPPGINLYALGNWLLNLAAAIRR